MSEQYYIICLEENAREGSLLFWRADGCGYTSSLEDAGLFDEEYAKKMNKEGRDIALTEKQLKEISSIYTIVNCPIHRLLKMKEEKKWESHNKLKN